MITTPPFNAESSTSATSCDSTGMNCSSEGSITSSSSEDDEDDLLFFPLMQYLIRGRGRCRIENYIQMYVCMYLFIYALAPWGHLAEGDITGTAVREDEQFKDNKRKIARINDL